MRIDRHNMRNKTRQRWVCRYAHRYNCPGKFFLETPNPAKLLTGALVTAFIEHNHYICPSESQDSLDSSTTQNLTSAECIRDRSNSIAEASANDLAISQLSAGDLSQEFGHEAMGARFCSSPLASAVIPPRPTGDNNCPLNETDTTVIDASPLDHRAYPTIKIIKRDPTK